MVELLVAFGALRIINFRRPSGRTPLMDACDDGLVYVVKALCEHGADVNMLDSHHDASGLAADHYARRCIQRGHRDQESEDVLLIRPKESEVAYKEEARKLDAFRTPLPPADGAGCLHVLQSCGIKPAKCSREQLWYASMGGEEVPEEYIVGLH